MTFRQRFLSFFYPLVMLYTKYGKRGVILKNKENIKPNESFYDLSFIDNKSNAVVGVNTNHGSISMSQFKGKKILLVNTASDCAYTKQFASLQQLQDKFKDKLVVIGFPSNEFMQQEKGSDDAIEKYCKINYKVSFALATKSIVRKGENQNTVYNWLTDKNKNGWNSKQPVWNFSKYLIDEEGKLMFYFGAAVNPESIEVF